MEAFKSYLEGNQIFSFVAKFSSDGNREWFRTQYGGRGTGIDISHDGSIYMTGFQFRFPLDGQKNIGGLDGFLTKYTEIYDEIPTTMSITSSDISSGSSNNHAFIELTFTASENTFDCTVDDIEIKNGFLLNFSGREKVYTAMLVSSGYGTCTVDVPASLFTGGGVNPNLAAQQFVWRRGSSQKKSDKEKTRMISKMLSMGKQSDVISILTQFRAFYNNNTMTEDV